MKKTILLPILSIALAAAVLFAASAGLSGVREKIAQENLNAVMTTLLPGSETFTEEAYTGEDANIRTTYKSENGYVVHVVTSGYAGDISMLVGVSSDGRVTGLVIRDMKETPGLGRKALTDSQFLAQFLNTDGTAAVGENIDALTGATVTSKAVTQGVNSAVSFVTGADSSSGATTWGE